MAVYKSIDELIGNTPIVELKKLSKKYELSSKIYAKLECFNPGGSIKDRVAKQMLDDAELKGLVNPSTTIIEPTSGNTGIGLASVGAMRDYKTIIVMPDSMSAERRKIISAYGSEVVLTDGKLGMKGAIKKAKEIAAEIPNSFVAGQFVNPSNPKAHYLTTAKEMYEQLDGNIDILVCSVGTGGTITGIGKYMKEKNPCVQIVAVEPENSAILSGENPGSHKIQGIGAGFIPEILDVDIIDTIVKVHDDMALEYARDFAKCEGMLVGISSGAALFGAVEIAKRQLGKNIAVILPDTGERYLSTELYN